MTPKSAAARGFTLAMLWAATLFSFLAAARTLWHGGPIRALADPLFERDSFSMSPAYVVTASILAAGTTGGAMGLLGRRVKGTPLARTVILALASLPALFAVIWLTLTLIAIPNLAEDGVVAVLLAPVGALLYAAVGVVFVAPIALPPGLIASLMLEGWTRPESQPQHGLANARLRRWIMHVLVAAIAAFTTIAVARWPRS